MGALLKGLVKFLMKRAAKAKPKPPAQRPAPSKKPQPKDTSQPKKIAEVIAKIELISFAEKKLAQIKENCKQCPDADCPPPELPVGSRCIQPHHHPAGKKFHRACKDPKGGHVHVLLQQRSPYPVCKCFFDRKPYVCVSGDVNWSMLLTALQAYPRCPRDKTSDI